MQRYLLSVVLLVAIAHFSTPVAAKVLHRYDANGTRKKTSWSVRLEADKCYWFSGASAEEVEKIQFYLHRPTRERVEKESAPASEIVVKYCAPFSGTYKATLLLPKEKIAYAFGLYDQKPQAIVRPEKKAPPGDQLVAQLSAEVEKEAHDIAASAHRSHNLFNGNTEASDWNIELKADHCYWFIGVGEKSIRRLNLYLWDQQGRRLTQVLSKSRKSSIGFCIKQTSIYRLQAKIVRGSGTYVVGIYEK